MRKQLQPGDEKRLSRSHWAALEPQAHLSYVQINLFPMRRRTMHPCHHTERKRQLSKFCVSVNRTSAPSTCSIASVNTTPWTLPETARKEYPRVSFIQQQLWQTNKQLLIRTVGLEARLFEGRLLAAGQSDLSLPLQITVTFTADTHRQEIQALPSQGAFGIFRYGLFIYSLQHPKGMSVSLHVCKVPRFSKATDKLTKFWGSPSWSLSTVCLCTGKNWWWGGWGSCKVLYGSSIELGGFGARKLECR